LLASCLLLFWCYLGQFLESICPGGVKQPNSLRKWLIHLKSYHQYWTLK
jgi:hypothetical protein